MTTFVYMVRHGESPKEPGGDERTRGLTREERRMHAKSRRNYVRKE